eukprot:TRINITY_DN70355_c0_g1_i1.p1 TRINITY_DN70355_c0_g1~~TRINITY_DN70355_c0_g1_i1.p1  ORF type:complete len:264 (+),score=107.58 TRINITY_DN70355_c0_g1_i1:77-793(+)
MALHRGARGALALAAALILCAECSAAKAKAKDKPSGKVAKTGHRRKAAGVTRLNADNWADETSSEEKKVFIMFSPVGCDATCDGVFKDWARLASQYRGSRRVLIAEVVCEESPDVCEQHNVKPGPMPVFKLGQGGPDVVLQDYDPPANPEFDELSDFAEDNVGKKCKGKKKKKSLEDMHYTEIQQRIGDRNSRIQKLQKKFEDNMERIKQEYLRELEALEMEEDSPSEGDEGEDEDEC